MTWCSGVDGVWMRNASGFYMKSMMCEQVEVTSYDKSNTQITTSCQFDRS